MHLETEGNGGKKQEESVGVLANTFRIDYPRLQPLNVYVYIYISIHKYMYVYMYICI